MKSKPLIYALLPEIYRKRDAQGDLTLLALTELLDETRAAVELNITGLYRDWFAETCALWVLPYIARLAGRDGPPPNAADPRALVTDAIAFARRKGTFPAMEHELAALTGWPVQLGFDAGTAVARFWPEAAYAVAQVSPRPWQAGAWQFHPMGIDTALFAAPRPYAGIEAPFIAALDAPVALTLAKDKPLLARAIHIWVEDETGAFREIPVQDMAVADLADWRVPVEGGARAVVDPTLGRFLILDPVAKDRRLLVGFAYAATGNVGGGGYEREMAQPDELTWVAHVHADAVAGTGAPAFRTLAEALEAWRSVPDHGLIRILDGSAHDVDGLTIGEAHLVCAAEPNAPRRLTIEALSGEAPVLRGTLRAVGRGIGLDLVLSGLWIDGQLKLEGRVEARLEHCSLHGVTARSLAGVGAGPPPAVATAEADGARPTLELHACLTGPLRLAGGTLTLSESAVDGEQGGMAIDGHPDLKIVRTTLIGGAALARLDALDSIFGSPVTVSDQAMPLVRFCFVPAGVTLSGVSDSVTGQPGPDFESTVFGAPGYARPDPASSAAIRTGASNGSEIGLFNAEHAAQREALLTDALARSLPVGMARTLERQTLAG